MENNNKKRVMVGVIVAVVLLGIFGVTFAMWTYSNTLSNQKLIAGNVFMKYTESNQIEISNAMPSDGPGDEYFSFTIEGRNTYSKPIYYEIVLNYGDVPNAETGRTERIKDNLLMFRLVETKDGVDTTVLGNATYADLKNKKIWVNNIPANQSQKVKITYKLYMWISGKTIIGNTEDAVYGIDTWNKIYASIKVSVNGDFKEKELDKNGVNIIKNTLGNKGGVIGISNTNQKVIAVNNDIREYRYSGLDVNNYVYFNCTDGLEQNADNCEKWRIIGIFKDENEIEHLKIVKNEVLKRDMFPATYEKNETTYNIQYTGNGDYVYWNNKTIGINNNDWATAGLQYWLNSGNDVENKSPSDGYMSYLSKIAKSMIEEKTKYYLGTVTQGSVHYIEDTTNEIYKYERAIEGCVDGKGPSENSSGSVVTGNSSCRVWANNEATWEGSIALLYPSDYGYSTDSKYWKTILGHNSFESSPSSSSWLQIEANHGSYEYLLSPSSGNSNGLTDWNNKGFVGYNGVDHSGVRPTLYLKSQTKIVGGDGTERNCYKLEQG